MNGFIVLSLLSKNTFSVMIILIDEYDLLLLKKNQTHPDGKAGGLGGWSTLRRITTTE